MIVFLIILLLIALVIFYIYLKCKSFLKESFNTTDLKKIIKDTELEEQTREKTLYGMESVYLPILNKDFKELNIDELKAIAEQNIIDCLTAIKEKDYKSLNTTSNKVLTFVKGKITGKNNIYEEIKIHRTILNRYSKNNNIATITFQTSLQYKNNDKLKQDRLETEFIYIIDAEKVKTKAIGLNCPNCGAPIKNLGDKQCTYCKAGVVDIVKRVWTLNNIKEI